MFPSTKHLKVFILFKLFSQTCSLTVLPIFQLIIIGFSVGIKTYFTNPNVFSFSKIAYLESYSLIN